MAEVDVEVRRGGHEQRELEKAGGGESRSGALETLYGSPFYDELVAAAAAICASDVEAEGIVQEVFIEDWDWRPFADGKGEDGGSEPPTEEQMLEQAKGRLRRKVGWRARTARRTQDRRAAKEGRILYEYRLARTGSGRGPEEEYRRRRCAKLLSHAVAALGERERAAWILVRMRGCSYARAAEALGCSKRAVEQRLYRAKKRIRAWLEERGIRCLDDIA